MKSIDTKELHKITMLYVEDDPEIFKHTVLFFEKILKNIYAAKDGEEALEIFKEKQKEIDIIVTDINMPKMDGLELLGHINKMGKRIPTIVTTAHTESSYLMDAINLKVDKFISKPVLIKDLTTSMIDLVLKYKRMNNLEILAKDLVQKQSQTNNLNQTLSQNVNFLNSKVKYYENIIDNFVLTLVTDKVGTITSVSNKFCRLLGYKEDEIVGKNISILKCNSCNSESFQQTMLKVIHMKKTITVSYTLISNSGKSFDCDVTITPNYGEDSLLESYKIYVDIL